MLKKKKNLKYHQEIKKKKQTNIKKKKFLKIHKTLKNKKKGLNTLFL